MALSTRHKKRTAAENRTRRCVMIQNINSYYFVLLFIFCRLLLSSDVEYVSLSSPADRQPLSCCIVAADAPPPPPPPRPRNDNARATSSFLEQHHHHQQQQQRRDSFKYQEEDDNNVNHDQGIIQVIESEIWDTKQKIWIGGTKLNVNNNTSASRWTNEKQQPSLSPSELQPTVGYKWISDWKIVIGSASGDPMGWEYSYRYLQPPQRKRIWLRSIQKIPSSQKISKDKPRRRRRQQQQQQVVPALSQPSTLPKINLPFRTSTPLSSLSQQRRRRQQQIAQLLDWNVYTILQNIKDDWNFKGYGLSIYKSILFWDSFGFGIRLPLSVNFDYFDRHPELPQLSTSLALFFPSYTIAGYISASIHMEWLKWIIENALGIIPKTIMYILYNIVWPLLYSIFTLMLFPIRHKLPPSIFFVHNNKQQQQQQQQQRDYKLSSISNFWTSVIVAKPNYNSVISERLGCSISYRYSIKDGYEFRISYSHSYLPTIEAYREFIQQFMLQTQQQPFWNIISTMIRKTRRTRKKKQQNIKKKQQGGVPSINSNDFDDDDDDSVVSTSDDDVTTSKDSKLKSSSFVSSNIISKRMDWLDKHFTRLGITTGYPVPTTPYFSCSALISLSGLFFTTGSGKQSTITSPTSLTTGKSSSSSSNPMNRGTNIKDIKKTILSSSASTTNNDEILSKEKHGKTTTSTQLQRPSKIKAVE